MRVRIKRQVQSDRLVILRVPADHRALSALLQGIEASYVQLVEYDDGTYGLALSFAMVTCPHDPVEASRASLRSAYCDRNRGDHDDL